MQLESFLEATAERMPDKTALVAGRCRWTYAELDALANRLANGLLGEGIERGDRVAICLENSLEAAAAIFAALKAGATFMMVNPTTKADKLRSLLDDSQAAALVATSSRLRALAPSLVGAFGLRLIVGVGGPLPCELDAGPRCLALEELLAGSCDAAPAKRAIDLDLAALIYTSGSTGVPKGVMLTHANLVAVISSIADYLENTAEDVILNVLPLSFGYGLCQLFTAVKVGASLVLERSFAYPHAVLQRLVEHRATGFPLVPTMAAMLLQMDLSKYDFSSLRYLTNAGAALPTDHIRKLRRLLPHVRIYSMYGLTECLRASYLPPEEIDRRPDSVGRGIPNQEAYVVDEEGRRAAPGVVGELVVRGSHVMQGYWNLPAETEQRLRPGPLPGQRVLYTGDLFRTDQEGFLYFVGRKDDIIKSRGEKVSPKEVENVLYQHPAVAEAAVVGVPDAILGQAVKAVVVLRQDAAVTERELLRHCAGRLEDFMVPKVVEIRPSLPRTANGKIDKRALLATPESPTSLLDQTFPSGDRAIGPQLRIIPAAFSATGQNG